MEETNRTLALLLVAAIVVSLGGTIVSLNKLGEFETSTLTGRASSDTGSGTVQLNITDNTVITFTADTVNFGAGYVNSSCTSCTMNTNSSAVSAGYSESGCCLGDWSDPSTAPNFNTGLWVENEGNTNLTVNLNSSTNAQTFLGGTSATPYFQWKISNDNGAADCTGGTCTHDDTADSCAGGWSDTTWTNVSTTNAAICSSYGFTPYPTSNEFIIDIKVTVPQDANVADRTATLTVTGTSA